MDGKRFHRTGSAFFLTLMAVLFAALPQLQGQNAVSGKFRLAIIGLRHGHAWGQLREIPRLADVEVVAVAEPDEFLQNEAKKSVPEARYYSDYVQMLDEMKPDAVWAFVENNRHLEITEETAPRKIHTVFEKPLASTLADAREMVYLAKQNGILLMTNYQMAWWPVNYAAHAAAEEGKLGRVWRVHGIVGHGGPGWPRKPGEPKTRGDYFFEWLNDPVRNGGGAFIDFQCYTALWAAWFLGKPESVQAMVNHIDTKRYNVDDNSVIVCTYPKGVAIMEGSWSLPRGFQDVEVFGDRAGIYVDRNSVEYRIGGNPAQKLELPVLPEHFSSPVQHLVHCVRTGEPLGTLVAPEINLVVMEIIEAARLSIETGRTVPLPLY